MKKTVKFSRQREEILNNLRGRYDHPCADTIFHDVRQIEPNISLGTVYRNLALLEETGEIQRLRTKSGGDRYDANSMNHYHFCCEECGEVQDVPVEPIDGLNADIGTKTGYNITGHSLMFYGVCQACSK